MQISLSQTKFFLLMLNIRWPEPFTNNGQDNIIDHYMVQLNKNITITNETSVTYFMTQSNDSSDVQYFSLYPVNCVGESPSLNLNFTLRSLQPLPNNQTTILNNDYTEDASNILNDSNHDFFTADSHSTAGMSIFRSQGMRMCNNNHL